MPRALDGQTGGGCGCLATPAPAYSPGCTRSVLAWMQAAVYGRHFHPMSLPLLNKTTLPFLAIACISFAQDHAAEPVFVDRDKWTSSVATMEPALKQPLKIRLVTIHHTETHGTDGISREREKELLEQIRREHLEAGLANNEKTHWKDIAYHYIIGPSGDVYRCRDISFQSDSRTILRSDLEGSITVCLLGDFRTKGEKQSDKPPLDTVDQIPTAAALESLASVVAMELNRHGLGASAVKMHRDLRMIAGGSDCPGGLLYSKIASELLPNITEKLRVLQHR